MVQPSCSKLRSTLYTFELNLPVTTTYFFPLFFLLWNVTGCERLNSFEMKLNQEMHFCHQQQLGAWSMGGQAETLPIATAPEINVKSALEPKYQLYCPCRYLQMLTGLQWSHTGIHILSVVQHISAGTPSTVNSLMQDFFFYVSLLSLLDTVSSGPIKIFAQRVKLIHLSPTSCSLSPVLPLL